MVSPWLGIHSSACYRSFVMLLLEKVRACSSGSVNSKLATTEGEKGVNRELNPYESSCSYSRGCASYRLNCLLLMESWTWDAHKTRTIILFLKLFNYSCSSVSETSLCLSTWKRSSAWIRSPPHHLKWRPLPWNMVTSSTGRTSGAQWSSFVVMHNVFISNLRIFTQKFYSPWRICKQGNNSCINISAEFNCPKCFFPILVKTCACM